MTGRTWFAVPSAGGPDSFSRKPKACAVIRPAGPAPRARLRLAAKRAARRGSVGAHRRGAVLVVALVCVGIASLVFLSLLKVARAERQRLETRGWQVQAAWLVESGLERARARLAREPNYTGETWNVPTGLLGGQDAGVVRIRVESPAGKPRQRLVHVQADYPDHPHQRARESKQALVHLAPR